MRHESKRVPGKNYRPLVGQPLYQHIIKSLLDCPVITEVIIDTDSPTIMEDASGRFPEVRLIERPEGLRADTIPMNDVLLHDVTRVEADYYLQTHSTNPLLSTETITRAIDLFMDKYPSYDSLFSVTRMQKRLWDGQGQAINHDPNLLLRTQDLPAVYEENSCIYIFSKSGLEAQGNRIGERPFMFEIDAVEAWDIDDELDFRVAEFLYQQRAAVRV
ncbi:MAG: acylneuraminate cytidylyltransferase family protein [Planctomycetota bacterium]|nr:MAG: acylneuraminate cytidylyltransferase family protein [Planctomycetota bacterium]